MPAYDTVISIGGQSLADGVWRLLGPSLEGLSNPLPLALPGFSEATMRITRMIPVLPGPNLPGAALYLLAAVELEGQALLNITEGLPGNLLAAGTPLPSVVPMAIDLTPSAPLVIGVRLSLAVAGINPMTRHGLLIDVTQTSLCTLTLAPALAKLTPEKEIETLAKVDFTGVVWDAVSLDPALSKSVEAQITDAIPGVLKQLGIEALAAAVRADGLLKPASLSAASGALLNPVPDAVRTALSDAFTMLLGATGRLLFPETGEGASCDALVQPTMGEVRLDIKNDTYVLTLAFGRPASTDIKVLPEFVPFGGVDTRVTIGNAFLVDLLCCLLKRLPSFTLPTDPVPDATDVNRQATNIYGVPHLKCCNFDGVTLDLGPIALTGGLSVCLEQGPRKAISLIGHFVQTVTDEFFRMDIAHIAVDFTLPLSVDLNGLASLDNLRMTAPPQPKPEPVRASISPSWQLIGFLGAAGVLLIGPAVGVVAIILVSAAAYLASSVLNNAVRTVLRQASMVTSPVAVPPGVLEAFGELVPVTLTIDDLTADSVLRTPTAPWALLPRIGIVSKPADTPPPPPTHRPPTSSSAETVQPAQPGAGPVHDTEARFRRS